MALKTVTGKVSGASNTALSAPTVWISLSQSAVITGTQEVLNSPIPVSVASDGTYSVQLQANGDLTPSTTYYTATEAVATGTVPQYVTSQLTFVVPQTAGPFVMSLIATPPPALGPAWDATLVHLAGAETLTGVKGGAFRDWGGAKWNALSSANPSGAAVGDGNANDQASLVATLVAAGAGCAEFPGPKTYLFNAPLKSNNGGAVAQTIAGTSRGGSILKLANASTPDYHLTPWNTHVHYRDFTVDGNKANNASSTSPSILLWADNCSAQNVRSLNEKADGLQIQSNGCSIIASHVETPDGAGIRLVSTASFARVIANRVDTPGGNAIFASQNIETLNVIALNTIKNPGGIGIAAGSLNTLFAIVANAISGSVGNAIDTGSCVDMAVVANVINTPGGPAINPDTGQRNAILGNLINVGNVLLSNGSTDAVGNTGRDHVAIGNIASGSTAATISGGLQLDCSRYVVLASNLSKNHSATMSAFLVDQQNAGSSHVDRILILGNIGYDDRVTKLQQYGLNIRSAVARSVSVLHNDFRGNLLGAINDAGTDTYTHGVLGYNPRGTLTPPVIPASTVIFQNPFNVDCTVYIAGGTLTAIGVGGMPAPVNWGAQPTLADSATGGTLTASTTYAYRVAARNAAGHTVECAEVTIAAGGGGNTHKITISLPTGVGLRGITGWDIYGRSSGAELLMASNWQRDVFVDDGSITPSGAMPGTDTTGNTATGITAAAPAGAVHSLRVMYGQGIKLTYSVAPTWTWFGD